MMTDSEDLKYSEFKKRYNIRLNAQQDEGVKNIEGANLLLAVPGSGKTTVLVTRIGYMILEKHISPYNILALTYNVAAAKDMRERFISFFGSDAQYIPQFRTINSLAFDIYNTYCKSKNFRGREMILEKDRILLLRNIYKNVSGNVLISETDIKFLSSNFTYIKNMGLDKDGISEFNDEMPKFSEMYEQYLQYLKSNSLMDFDDQLVFAKWVLLSNPDILKSYRDRYKYICVDEAQDTSKIQHEIIALLAKGGNIFMVGDEDQSIYGFRAAYPQALLNFKGDYKNAHISKMEYNYRSTPKITEKAARFISKNTGRYEKNIIPTRDDAGEVKIINVKTREDQFDRLLKAAKERKNQTAFLYRDNATAVALIDLFLRNDIPFIHKKADINFFETKTVLDMLYYLILLSDPYDTEAFERVCNKGIIFIKSSVKYSLIHLMKKEGLDFYKAILKNKELFAEKQRDYLIKDLKKLKEASLLKSPKLMIKAVRSGGYDKYMSQQKTSPNNIDLLEILAGREETLEGFFERIETLKSESMPPIDYKNNPVILSTIHSSKGLEYDTVYMVDVFDSLFPSAVPNPLAISKKMSEEELEERRLFYVGITRSKNNLYLMRIENCITSFIDELFPAPKKAIENASTNSYPRSVQYAWETTKQLNEKRLQRQNQKILDAKCLNEVKNQFTDDTKIVKDHLDRKWVKCDICHKIKLSDDFSVYCDNGRCICNTCQRKGLSF